jgi:peptidoglycan/LPS O-acetylase OafA/YrhL
VVFALDIVAWDLFLGVALLLASPVLRGWPSMLLAVSGVLCLAGITGAVTGDMNVRDIGIVGYAVVLPVALLLQGRRFASTVPPETTP